MLNQFCTSSVASSSVGIHLPLTAFYKGPNARTRWCQAWTAQQVLGHFKSQVIHCFGRPFGSTWASVVMLQGDENFEVFDSVRF